MEDGLWELMAAGLVTADGFRIFARWSIPNAGAARAAESTRRAAPCRPGVGRRAAPRRACRLRKLAPPSSPINYCSVAACFRTCWRANRCAPPWRDLLPYCGARRRKEEVRGGRFVAGFSGGPFARPEALDLLQSGARGRSGCGRAAANSELPDPLNFASIVLSGAAHQHAAAPRDLAGGVRTRAWGVEARVNGCVHSFSTERRHECRHSTHECARRVDSPDDRQRVRSRGPSHSTRRSLHPPSDQARAARPVPP